MKVPALNEIERAHLLAELAFALSTVKNPEEASKFLIDLLSREEVTMLARRLRIARDLLRGDTFGQISWRWKVSKGTIARVSEWLKTSGEGYRLIWERMKGYEPPEIGERRESFLAEPFSAKWMRRRYPMYYWPSILLEEITRARDKERRERLLAGIRRLDSKRSLYKQLQPLLKAYYAPSRMSGSQRRK